MTESLADRTDFKNKDEEIGREALFSSLEFFKKELNLKLGNKYEGKLEIFVNYTGKSTVMPAPENVLKEKFGSYDNVIRYIEDLINKEATSEADKIENEEYFPFIKAAEPEKVTLQLVEEQKENSGRCAFLIEGNLLPLDKEHGFELMLVLCWESQNLTQELNKLKEINLEN